jgi:hypothetical protein
MAQNSILKTKKIKELDLILEGEGGNCPLLPLCGSATEPDNMWINGASSHMVDSNELFDKKLVISDHT